MMSMLDLNNTWHVAIFAIIITSIIGIGMTSYIMFAVNYYQKESNSLDSVKDDCKSLGNWIIDHSTMESDEYIVKAKTIYEVKCH